MNENKRGMVVVAGKLFSKTAIINKSVITVYHITSEKLTISGELSRKVLRIIQLLPRGAACRW
ncbi:MAG: hypothetical protein ACP5TZ_05855 [Nitrososphaeria archaeon]